MTYRTKSPRPWTLSENGRDAARAVILDANGQAVTGAIALLDAASIVRAMNQLWNAQQKLPFGARPASNSPAHKREDWQAADAWLPSHAAAVDESSKPLPPSSGFSPMRRSKI